ncbi:GerAB/ArcD/ProY family transporter [Paenibacillus andongensis]|uniref:GerAB/ArcD/ProY family transporter n=1 Tax=Paenibacillus andongensis TaxID=2975482 RepID=UPI0021BA8D14|nr:endospore germination permease [Paenibacillus andongensis]
MSKYSMNQISLKQYIFIICETQVGIGVLSLPRDLAKNAGTDGWISIVLGWIVSVLVSLVIIRVMEKNPEYTLFELLTKYFGNWVGKGLIAAWILFAAYSAITIMLATIHIIKIWIVPDIQNFILMILFIVPIYMITKQGIRVIGLFAEFVFMITLWMPFLLLLTLKDIEWMYLLPIGKGGLFPILSSIKSTVFSFLGFELAFILYPFLRDKKSASKGIVVANTLSMIIYLTITVICFVKFSPVEVTDYVYPVLNLLKVIHLPFLERLEIICLSFYLFIIFMTIIPYTYMAALGTSHLFGKQDHRNTIRINMILWIVMSFFFIPTSSQITLMGASQGTIGLCFAFVFPIFLWIYGWLFQRNRKEQRQ